MSATESARVLARLTPAGIGSGVARTARMILGGRAGRLDRVAMLLAAGLLLLAVVGAWLVPFDPYLADPGQALQAPNSSHWLGTDDAGRDILSRLLVGARSTLLAAVVVVACTVLLGVLVAALAALSPRWLDNAVMRLCDILLATPGMVLALGIAAALGPSLVSVVVAMTAAGWPATARFVRNILRATSAAAYVEAAQVSGIGRVRTMVRHVLPNSLDEVWVNCSMEIAGSIVLIAGLSYLGVGAPAPSADWGSMVADGREYITTAWWVATFPGLAITLASVAFGLLGDTLRVYLDPSLRRTR